MSSQAAQEYFRNFLNNYDLKERGAGSQKDPAVSRFSGMDVRHVFDHGVSKGLSKADSAQQVLDYWDRIQGTTKAGGKTRDALDVLRGYVNTSPTPTPTPTPAPTGSNNTTSGGSAPYSGSVNTVTGDGSNVGGISGGGDNTRDTVIYGDGNVVDHSNFQQYFGDEDRYFIAPTRKGGGYGPPSASTGLYDSPVSDATMMGFFGTKDTGKTAAEFIGKYAGNNEIWQKRGERNWKKNGDFDYTTDKYRAINPVAMQERIDRQPIIMRDRSTLAYNHLYGDLDQYMAPEWVMPENPSVIEDDIEAIANEFRNELS